MDILRKRAPGAASAAATLAGRLASYPSYDAPFRGPAQKLSLDEAKANLDHLLRSRPERLAALRRLLAEEGVPVPDDLDACPVAPLLDDLRLWAKERWPAIHDPRLAETDVWLASTRGGTEIVHALVLDVAILLGELVVRRREGYGWALNLDAEDEIDGMDTVRRPVVIKPGAGVAGSDVLLDYEGVVFGVYRNAAQPALLALNDMKLSVEDALSGAYEADATAAAAPDR